MTTPDTCTYCGQRYTRGEHCDYAGCHATAQPDTPFCEWHHDHEGTRQNIHRITRER